MIRNGTNRACGCDRLCLTGNGDTLRRPAIASFRVLRGIALRVAQLRAHHAARLNELAEAVASARAPRSAADVIPVLFRPPAI